ncbi:MAG: polyprenol monophosphomannose synthase [Acidimicrobiia bacterium]
MRSPAMTIERPSAPRLQAVGSETVSPPRVLVVIPTYCERNNIRRVLARVRAAVPRADILVVDDNSPDGTAEIVDSARDRMGNIRTLRRESKDGLGAAYRAGFSYGLDHGYDILVEMDADLSHDPAALPALIESVERGADLSIGSRYIPGASIPNWTRRRRALSRYGNAYAAFMLRIPVRDLTSGFRAYRADTLRAVEVETSRATGYAFQIELVDRVMLGGGSIVEWPIAFNDRTDGESKMSPRITVEALALVTAWGIRGRRARRAALFA